ncbi:phytoene desaturase family protein [Candidatus Omnitrophota bacterium]
MKKCNINTDSFTDRLKKEKFDEIIIGAGIGGLVCGCYLAKAGKKVLLIERNSQPGGYCSSFKRRGFMFDTGIHALEGFGEKGIFSKIFSDFSLKDKIEIVRDDIIDVIVVNDKRIRIKHDLDWTVAEFQHFFPSSAINIEKFLNFLTKKSIVSLYSELKDLTFADVLNRFIDNVELRSVICVLLRNIGLSSNKVAAINASLFLRLYLLQGGYYPLGGMSALSNALLERFKEYDGEIILSEEVEKIKLNNKKKAVGVMLKKRVFIKASNVISNCDASHTFLRLIGKKHLKDDFVKRIINLQPSVSAFVVFLGIKKSLKAFLEKSRAFWLLDDINADGRLSALINGELKWDESCIMISSSSLSDSQQAPSGKENLFIICNASFQDEQFWMKHKEELSNRIIKKAERVIPDLSKHIEIKEIATPHTFFKYTLNREGSIHGWAPLVSQIDKRIIPEKSPINGVFLTGHWITKIGQGGLPSAIESGYNVARMLKTSGKNAYMEEHK